jgi:endo-alpha-1,4-polygalactosaminidase (GH114 family)
VRARAAVGGGGRHDGSTVLAYLSVGTIERWRSWYPALKRYRLGAWEDWEDEFFADVSRAGLRDELTGSIAPSILAKGFDGLFLDNVDMIETRAHRAQRPGMRILVEELSELVHAGGGLLFAQNGAWILRRLGLTASIDGWNREDVTWTYDFDRRRYVRNRPAATRAALRELEAMAALGLQTTATDYTRAGDVAARELSVANACGAGALPYVGDIGLSARRLPARPLECP